MRRSSGPASSNRLHASGHRSRPETLAQRAGSGQFDLMRQATWGWSDSLGNKVTENGSRRSTRLTRKLLSIFLAVPFACPVSAQDDLPMTTSIEIIELCEQALNSGEDISTYAVRLSQLIGLELDPPDRFRGMACLREHFGERYFFNNEDLSFISASEYSAPIREEQEALQAARCQVLEELAPLQLRLSELMDSEALAERRLEISAIAARSETLSACRDWYEEDRLSALTNPVCSSYFEQFGTTPTVDNVGYDPEELSILQGQVFELNSDLLLIDRGILPREVRTERKEALRLAAISSLPEELQEQAQNMSTEEIGILRVDFEREQCE